MKTQANILTIAGSDSCCGAGIQADLKTFAAHEVYGTSVITNVTAQNSLGVHKIHILPLDIIEAQIKSVFDDISISAVKIGMLNTVGTVELVAKLLKVYQPEHIIIDPVMISSSGKRLLAHSAYKVLVNNLLPLATLITPNIPEAACLLNVSEIEIQEDLAKSTEKLLRLGSKSVLLKGGHLSGETCINTLSHLNQIYQYPSPKIATNNTHGTGCTLASAVSANLANNLAMPRSVELAGHYLHQSILSAEQLNVGRGKGPVHHFYSFKH